MCTENSILIDYVTESPKEVDAAGIIPCSDLPQTSNNIIQKGLAFVREQSGSVTVPGTRRASGSCPAGCKAVAADPGCGLADRRRGRRVVLDWRNAPPENLPMRYGTIASYS